jgi:cAMP-dependent protein kinase regulator
MSKKMEESQSSKFAEDSASSSEGSDDDVYDLPEVALPVANRGRRKTVMAAPLKVDADWRPPRYDKTDEEQDEIRQSVANNVLFSTLEEKEMDIIVAAFNSVSFDDGDDIIVQGDTDANLFYVMRTNSCDIFVDGRKVIEVGPGQSFGELALLYDSPRAATVRAVGNVRCWALDRVTFKMILMDATMKRRRLYESFVNDVPILQTLRETERLTVADAFRSVQYMAGDTIIAEGEAGDVFYVIKSGEVACTKAGYDQEVSERLTSGYYFGELALLNNSPRAATVTAVKDTTVLTLSRATFKRLLGPLEDSLRRNIDVYDRYVRENSSKK